VSAAEVQFDWGQREQHMSANTLRSVEGKGGVIRDVVVIDDALPDGTIKTFMGGELVSTISGLWT
jgi:hypothetical protein